MESVRLAGVVVATLFAGYGVLQYRNGKWRRLDLLLALFIAIGIGVFSVFPQAGNILTQTLNLKNRLFAVLVTTNILLFVLFFYLLNQIRASNRRNGDLIRALARREFRERFPGAATPSRSGATSEKVLVIIPAYNEQDCIGGVLKRMPREVCGREVQALVVVDGATDATEAVVLEHGFPVATHIINSGGGAALRTGAEIARQGDFDVVVNMDADGQHQPEEVERLVAPIVAGEADFTWGSRFFGYYEERGSIRHAGIVLFSRILTLLTRANVTDCTNGFRAVRASCLAKLDLREEQFHTTEMILEASKKQLRMCEVPVSVLKRVEGESKKPKKLRYPLGVARVILKTWLR